MSRKSPFSGGEAPLGVSLNLTALMDILSNLLFFLLASYNAQAIEAEQNAKLVLPSSTSPTKMLKALTIQVASDKISVAGVPVADIKDNKIVGQKEVDDPVPGMAEKLKRMKAVRKAAGQEIAGPEGEIVLLMADKNTDSQIVTSVLKTVGMAGFVNVKFGVISQ